MKAKKKAALLWLAIVTTTSPALAADTLTVAVATNFKPVLELLVTEFTQASPVRVQISTGSTGAIYARIKNGAPYDIFLAADSERPRLLEQEGLIIPGSRFTYAIGRLVFWMPGADSVSEASIREIDFPLAIANPNLAPYGRAAIEALQMAGRGDLPLVQGTSVSQTAAFIATGNAAGGFVALSQVRKLNVSASEYWLLPTSWHQPIAQQLVVLRHTRPGYEQFVAFLKSPAAREMIDHAGYQVSDSD